MHNDGRFDFHNAVRYSSDELANILTHCFENYIVRFVLDGPAFAARFGAEDLSLNDSLIVTHRQEPVAVALIGCCRSWRRSRRPRRRRRPSPPTKPWRGAGATTPPPPGCSGSAAPPYGAG